MSLAASAARLALLAAIGAAIWWDVPNHTLRATLLTGLQWALILVLALGFLMMPKRTIASVLRGVALTFIDLRSLFRCLDRPWRQIERGIVVIAAVAMTSLTFLTFHA